jgi:hypothetical protein
MAFYLDQARGWLNPIFAPNLRGLRHLSSLNHRIGGEN